MSPVAGWEMESRPKELLGTCFVCLSVKAQAPRAHCTCSPRLAGASPSLAAVLAPMALQLCQLAVVLLVFVSSMFGSSVAIVLPDMFSFPP